MDYTCAVVEGYPSAAATLERYISRTSFLKLMWVATSIEEAMGNELVDLLIVEMDSIPTDSENPFLRLVRLYENVIVMSIYPEETCETISNLVDFLTKPVSFDAFAGSMQTFLEKKA